RIKRPSNIISKIRFHNVFNSIPKTTNKIPNNALFFKLIYLTNPTNHPSVSTKIPSLRDYCLGVCNIDCYKDAIPTGLLFGCM
ncbi:MAG: hypothetical protein WCR29_07620, partial [Bacteroidales bacterium]